MLVKTNAQSVILKDGSCLSFLQMPFIHSHLMLLGLINSLYPAKDLLELSMLAITEEAKELLQLKLELLVS